MTTKRNLKIEKLLSKAFNNSSKDEATTAFGMAFSIADKEGVRLAEFRGDVRVVYEEKIVYRDGGLNSERERELVKKYNDVLARAKDLRDENDKLTTRMHNAEYTAEQASRSARIMRQQVESLQLQANAAISDKEQAERLTGVQAMEIAQLRDKIEKAGGKQKNFLILAVAAGLVLGYWVTTNLIKPQNVAPVAVASAPIVKPAPVSLPAPTPAPLRAANTAPVEPARKYQAPEKMVRQEFNFPYGSVTAKGGKYTNLKVKFYDDGSIYDSVNGELTHVSGDQYRTTAGTLVRYERVNDFAIKIDGSIYIEDTVKGKSLAEVASAFRYYQNELYRTVLGKRVDLYITSANGRLVALLANQSGIQFTDINLIDGWKNYEKGSETEAGTLVFNKTDGSGKFVEATGTDPAYGNIELTSFRGNAVYKVTP